MAFFETLHRVRFQHCDPAGIVFYPRYFEMLNLTVERFFDEGLGWSFHRMSRELNVTTPTVHIEADFPAPSHLEDRLTFAMSEAAQGRSSLSFTTTATCGEQLRLTARTTLVCIDTGARASSPWPDPLRAAIATRIL